MILQMYQRCVAKEILLGYHKVSFRAFCVEVGLSASTLYQVCRYLIHGVYLAPLNCFRLIIIISSRAPPHPPSAWLLRYAITNVCCTHSHAHKAALSTCWVATVCHRNVRILRGVGLIYNDNTDIRQFSSKSTDSVEVVTESRVILILFKF